MVNVVYLINLLPEEVMCYRIRKGEAFLGFVKGCL